MYTWILFHVVEKNVLCSTSVYCKPRHLWVKNTDHCLIKHLYPFRHLRASAWNSDSEAYWTNCKLNQQRNIFKRISVKDCALTQITIRFTHSFILGGKKKYRTFNVMILKNSFFRITFKFSLWHTVVTVSIWITKVVLCVLNCLSKYIYLLLYCIICQ